MKATRNEVYHALDTERTYQENKWSRPAHNHSITEYLLYMREYAEDGLKRLSHEDSELIKTFALDTVRKVAALGVACMEEHGALPRE